MVTGDYESAGYGRSTGNTEGIEILVLEGLLEDGGGLYGPGTWLRLPAGADHEPRSPGGCLLYTKVGALPTLLSSHQQSND